jgi:hypothetical protein
VRAVDVELFVSEGVSADDARALARDARAQGFEQREGLDGRAGREGLFEGDARVDGRAHAPRPRVEDENSALSPAEGRQGRATE